ncbi:hypothetical protein [Muricoccus aerilatus]|nr:hypothetical protein [Roseomonas aerilata]
MRQSQFAAGVQRDRDADRLADRSLLDNLPEAARLVRVYGPLAPELLG